MVQSRRNAAVCTADAALSSGPTAARIVTMKHARATRTVDATRRSAWPFLLLAVISICAAHAKPYLYHDYSNIHERLVALSSAYPEQIKLDTAQNRFGLPSVGQCAERNVGGTGTRLMPCKIWIVTLTNHSSLSADPGRPEILISGELHGDEIIGPHAVLAFIELFVTSVAMADPYFTYLLNARLITLLPMTNAIGFHNRERGERQAPAPAAAIDPNRDFAFDQDPAKCMVTIAARAINELFRTHLFRILVTFHGGTNVIGYEWGDMTHCNGADCKPAPDTAIMDSLAKRMSEFAGPAGPFEATYPTGNMGALVYPVHGGMEDWAYGASWSGQAVQCKPSTFGGYPRAKTEYSRGTHRCITYLVETSRSKAPAENTLGDSDDVLVPGASGDGHVPRNVRLLVAVVDAAEPYILLGNSSLLNGSVLSSNQLDGMNVVDGRIAISWYVGGAFLVDGTLLQWSDAIGSAFGASPVANGSAGLKYATSKPSTFSHSIPFSPMDGDALYFRVAAVVDSSLGQAPSGSSPAVNVQSHLMASRISSSWKFENSGRQVRGRRIFYSETARARRNPATGKFSFSLDNSVAWGQRSGSPRAPSDDDTLSTLLGHEGKDVVQSGVGSSADEKNPLLDPRDRDGYVSGIVGIATIVFVTTAICVQMIKHYRRENVSDGSRAFTLDDDSEMNELKEPLHANEAEVNSMEVGSLSGVVARA